MEHSHNILSSRALRWGTILYLQFEHKFATVFQSTSMDLDVRYCDRRFFQPLIDLDPQVVQYINTVDFYDIRRVGYLTVDHDLINTLVEY